MRGAGHPGTADVNEPVPGFDGTVPGTVPGTDFID